MGFERRTFRLVWPEDSPWHGLEVVMRGSSVADLGQIALLQDGDEKERIAKLPQMADLVASRMMAWNYTVDGQPVPTSEVVHEEFELITAILDAWGSMGKVDAPLPEGSPGGGPSPEVSMLMVVPSASHQSSNTQS